MLLYSEVIRGVHDVCVVVNRTVAQYPDLRPQLVEAAQGGSRPMQLLSNAIRVLNNEAGLEGLLQAVSQDETPATQNPQIFRVRHRLY